ncbi:MAG: hypothetical protein ABIR96_06695 [Bdellovibrionota bacterium]
MLPEQTLRYLIKGLLVLSIFTAVGQVRIKHRSVEDRYHGFVNSDGFQTWFWAMALPVTWTGDKIHDGFASLKKKTTSSEDRDPASESAR